MRSNLLFCLLPSRLTDARCISSRNEPQGHDWQPPGIGDSRSPCPLLNAMANHGWLPRNGKALTLPMIQTALDDALGFEQDIFINITEAALAVSTTGNASTFNLQDTARHNAIEHDGSLSRNDFFFGDNLHFNLRIWRVTAARYGIGVPSNTSLLTVDVAARARAARIEDARRVNPNFTLTSSGLMGSYGETSVLLTTFWQAENAGAPKEWVRVLFEQERIPYYEGFKKRNHSLADVVDMINAVAAVPT